jgi:hypothetical protein
MVIKLLSEATWSVTHAGARPIQTALWLFQTHHASTAKLARRIDLEGMSKHTRRDVVVTEYAVTIVLSLPKSYTCFVVWTFDRKIDHAKARRPNQMEWRGTGRRSNVWFLCLRLCVMFLRLCTIFFSQNKPVVQMLLCTIFSFKTNQSCKLTYKSVI